MSKPDNMVLGFRCSPTDYTYAFLTGTQGNPTLLELETISFPKGYAVAHGLKWFYQEMQDLFKRLKVSKIVMKKMEGRAARGDSYAKRVEYEAMIYLAGYEYGLKDYMLSKKVNSTIAKDLGFKGMSRYLSKVDTSFIPEFDELNKKKQDAILVALSELSE